MKIKICGITNLEDALHAVACGADALGFNFYEKSSRYISPEAATEIIAQLPDNILRIGVFVNSPAKDIHQLRSVLDFVQLHGDEAPDYAKSLIDDGIKVIKAIHAEDAAASLEYKAVGFLLDTPTIGYGGSGETFDWELAVKFKKVVPEFYLAGGLTPENVSDAIRAVRPTAVDVCSGVELSKGKKDPKKVAAFIEAVRSVS
ncbi:MAG TPA: phosphoribosylanthranilate isomerase [Pyrinomonadaceae bacterium]|nr:phosphoribosylanthranilate isomerase [Pyrinomonadaceae bacterium]